MSAGPFTLYTPAKATILQGGIALGTAAIAAVLLSNSYTPNLLTDSTWANASADEVTGTGYTAGGQALASMSASSYGLGALSTIGSGGSAYAQTDVGKTVSISGGTNTVAATLTIQQVNNGTGTGAVTGIEPPAGGGAVLGTPGVYTALPSNPAATTGGGTTGSGLTINGVWGPVFLSGNLSWSATGGSLTARYCALVVGTAGSLSSTNKLLALCDLTGGAGGTVTATNAAFAVDFANGIVFCLA